MLMGLVGVISTRAVPAMISVTIDVLLASF
jgi:hypothetical protein